MNATFFILGWLASSMFFYAYQRWVSKRHIAQLRAIQECEAAVRGAMQTTINDMILRIRKNKELKESDEHMIHKLLAELERKKESIVELLAKLAQYDTLVGQAAQNLEAFRRDIRVSIPDTHHANIVQALGSLKQLLNDKA